MSAIAATSIRAGHHLPPGAQADARGVNFSIYARDAIAVELRLYERADSAVPAQIIALDPVRNRTFFFWHVYVTGIGSGMLYTWRVAGPGQSLAEAPELLDPSARAVSDARWQRPPPGRPVEPGCSLRAIVTAREHAPTHFRLSGSDLADAVIYELHVGGFTRHPSAGVGFPGTFSALIEKIPYLQALGITHVELMPVMAFDEQCVPPGVAARGLGNFWGYATCGFYAPHPRYCVDPAQAPQEFLECVNELHEAGIGVILDVAFNHTAEGGEDGPVVNFKAIGNADFYHHDPRDPRRYRDFTGCGNTVNCNHPMVANFIVHCLEHWSTQLGADGFRFDLASVFARGEDGEPMRNPPLPWNIELSRALIERPLIAEAWDAAGLYHVGSFPGMRWAEWNGRYRDIMRRFVRGDAGLIGAVATHIAGSSDLFADDHRLPANGINFITCHDGFTLADLVSFECKRNEANGEDNRDGCDHNFSWNCGAEGPTDDTAVLALRERQARNLMALLLLSQGVPMILAGDEVLRSQHGNNNAWCQDNPLGWFDWELDERQQHMLRFVREMIALRKRHRCLRQRRFLTGLEIHKGGMPDISWHGERLGEPRWQDPQARLLAFTLAGLDAAEPPLHVILNMADTTCRVALPRLDGRAWALAVDTARAPPSDITPPGAQALLRSDHLPVAARSVVVLEGEASHR